MPLKILTQLTLQKPF